MKTERQLRLEYSDLLNAAADASLVRLVGRLDDEFATQRSAVPDRLTAVVGRLVTDKAALPAGRKQVWRRLLPPFGLPRRVVYLAAPLLLVVALMGAKVLIQPPADLQDAVGSLFGEGHCVTATEAADGIRARLDSLGYEEWAIDATSGAADGCVVPGILTSEKLIVLMPVDRAPDAPEPFEFRDVSGPLDLQEGLFSLFSKGQCVTPTQAAAGIRAQLDSLGYEEWSVDSTRVASAGCVSAGFDTAQKLIILIPVSGSEVNQAVRAVRDELMRRCLGEEQAIELFSSALAAVGMTDATFPSDGPFNLPIDPEKREPILAHVAAGCFVYAGSGTESGRPAYFIAGPR